MNRVREGAAMPLFIAMILAFMTFDSTPTFGQIKKPPAEHMNQLFFLTKIAKLKLKQRWTGTAVVIILYPDHY
jgi:hypothetical protein